METHVAQLEYDAKLQFGQYNAVMADWKQCGKLLAEEYSKCNDLTRRIEQREKQYFQIQENAKLLLMSMVYSLDMVTAATTHHEKEVVVRHMKTVFIRLANTVKGLAVEPRDEDIDLPF